MTGSPGGRTGKFTIREREPSVCLPTEMTRFFEADDCSPRRARQVGFGSWSCQNGLGMSPGSQSPVGFQTAIAAIKGLTPMMFMTRVRL